MSPRTAALVFLGAIATGCSHASTGPLPPARSPRELFAEPPPSLKPEGAVYWGTVQELNGSLVTLALRDGKTLKVDVTEAQRRGRASILTVGSRLVVNGPMANGVLNAHLVNRAKGPASWGSDVPE